MATSYKEIYSRAASMINSYKLAQAVEDSPITFFRVMYPFLLNAFGQISKPFELVEYLKYRKEPQYQIENFVASGGLLANHKVQFTVNDLPYVVPTISKPGYYFLGWYSEPEYINKVSVITTVGNKKLYAKWEKDGSGRNYTITYNLNGGTWYNSKKDFKLDFLKDFFEYLGRPGEDFNKFVHSNNNEHIEDFDGEWQNFVNQLYQANDKSIDENKPYFINQPIYNKKWIPFFDWLDDLIRTSNPEQDFWGSVFVGTLRLREYIKELRFTDRGYPGVIRAYQIYNSKTGLSFIPVPFNNSNVRFLGWYTNPDFSGNPITNIPAGEVGDKVLYAKWEYLNWNYEYTLNYELNGGVLNSYFVKYKLNDLPLTLPIPIRSGYVFAGWYLNNEFRGDKIERITQDIANDMTLYAKWVKIGEDEVYNIEYIIGEESDAFPLSFDVEIDSLDNVYFEVYVNGNKLSPDKYYYDVNNNAIVFYNTPLPNSKITVEYYYCGEIIGTDNPNIEVNLRDYSIQLIATFAVRNWLEKAKNRELSLQANLGAKDYNMFSPANLLKENKEIYKLAYDNSLSQESAFTWRLRYAQAKYGKDYNLIAEVKKKDK